MWAVYMLLLYTRWSSGWRGRRAAFLATFAFVVALGAWAANYFQPHAQVYCFMNFIVIGVNHQTAPVEVREQFAIPEARLPEAAKCLASYPGSGRGDDRLHLQPGGAAGAHGEWHRRYPDGFMRQFYGFDPAPYRKYLYEYRERDAVRHVFRVASSLDSMVVGEPQILGQVKEAYATARAVGAVNSQLDALLTRAFAVAKRVRNETAIATSAVSVASVAVDLAKKIFGNLEGKSVYLVGRGQDVRAGRASPYGPWREADLRRQSHL